MVIGNTPQIKASLLAPAATIPSWIASSFREASSVGLHRAGLLALAVTLVIMAFVLALLSRLLVRRSRELIASPTVEEAASESALRISG
jgi:phosphate transport system permease protein